MRSRHASILLLTLSLLIILSACTSTLQSTPPTGDTKKTSFTSPAEACISLCQQAREANITLISQCLADPLEAYPDWVCDVAHQPRQPVDDQPENQCLTFRQRKAHHFIEVTPDCRLIRIV